MTVLDHAMPRQPSAPADPRLALLCVILLALPVAALGRLPVAAMALALTIGLAFAMQVRLREALHRLAHVEGFLVVLLALLPFTTAGRPVLTLGPLVASAEGLGLVLLIAAKVNTVALLLLALTRRMAPERLGQALFSLGAPARFVRLLELLFRHIHTARDSLRRQSEAMRARAFRPRPTLHSWRSHGHLFGGALLRALDRAERVDEAIRMRGGPAQPGRLPPLSRRDRGWIVLAALAGAALVALDRLA